MSGGRWDYCGFRILSALETISQDSSTIDRWPKIAGILADLGGWLYRVEQELDYDLSGDRPIKDDKGWQNKKIAELDYILHGKRVSCSTCRKLVLVNKARLCPDGWIGNECCWDKQPRPKEG